MTTLSLTNLPIRCPECRRPVAADGDRIVCTNGHEAGRTVDDVLDFSRSRTGAEGELVEFWNSSDAYYKMAGDANVDFADADHATHRRVLDTLAERGAADVLDVGCGTAEVAVALAERLPGASYVGIDVSRLAPRRARELGRPGTFLVADGERMPFADASFDGVVSFFALEHFAHPRETITEMARVLRPGGTLALVSVSYDRAGGIIPSVRFGLVRGGRKLPRWHPANVATYALNRSRFAARQALKQARYALDDDYLSFEVIERPLALDAEYRPLSDYDAVHAVSGRSVARLLALSGVDVTDTNLPTRPSLRLPTSFWLIGTKRAGS